MVHEKRIKNNLKVGGLILGLIIGLNMTLMAADANQPLTNVSFGISYIPNVQFAPIYVAQKKGFYADAGLKVSVEYGYENDFVALAAQGKRDFAAASGDQVIIARSQGLPVVYVMEWYHRYPVALIAPKSKKIKRLADLKGKSVGLPGFFGSSYVGWKALVYATKLDESAVTLKQIGFTQASALQQNIVDAAVVYIVNEPIQLRAIGMSIDVFEVSDYINLISNGVVVGEKLMRDNPSLVRHMVQATMKGIAYTIDHPEEAFQISRQYIPELTDSMAPIQRKVLDASIELWKSDTPGKTSRRSWAESVDFMRKTKLLKKPVDVDSLFSNEFVDQ